ncbi:hypothetical protein AVEN_262831-1 [Araneus ventricosus]|uniref:Uncharacterized protein n=1 Tax=Araneus ventricosus TaxID=182803 RepID=A0A4Y2CGR6_ARAVE|nr:hypothetical protein AVEN_262831-1 [Araneus ventricosus]
MYDLTCNTPNPRGIFSGIGFRTCYPPAPTAYHQAETHCGRKSWAFKPTYTHKLLSTGAFRSDSITDRKNDASNCIKYELRIGESRRIRTAFTCSAEEAILTKSK